MRRPLLWAVFFLSTGAAGFATERAAADPMDWPFWRGPEQNGISRETGLVDSWSPDGENLLWIREDLGGKSTPIVMRGKLYTIVRHKPETPLEQEKVVCIDAATGKDIWEKAHNVYLSDVPDTRIGWSSVVGDPETGQVYALGVNGLFQCFDGDTGEILWSHSMSEEYGLLTTYGGRTNYPVVFEDVVIISGVMIGWGEFAKPNHRYIAFDKNTGQTVWFNATRPLPDDTTFSCPILGSFNGQLLLVAGAGDGYVYGMQPRTGRIIWKYRLSIRGINNTPLIDGNTVYVAHAEENPGDTSMGALVAIPGDRTGEIAHDQLLWRDKQILTGRSSPLLMDGRLYWIDDGAGLYVLDAKTGEEVYKQKLGTVMRSSPVYADGKIYAMEANGRWWILKPTPDGDKAVEVVHKLRLPGENQASPIVSHGRIYLMTTEGLFCIGDTSAQTAVSQRGSVLAETPLSADDAPAHIQIVPVESLIRPGETIDFKTLLFNENGQPLGAADASAVSFSVDANGSIQGDGKFTADMNADHKAATVTAKVGDKTSVARVRIVPDLPWKFDFNDNEIPIPWIGARYRHVVRDVDGEKVAVKVSTIPKGTRSKAWMGHPDMHDYTIQADVRGAQKALAQPGAVANQEDAEDSGDAGDENPALKSGKMPDIGLIAQRYTFDMKGDHQQLQIRMWDPILTRMSATVPFQWKPDVWYTMKFRAANEDGKAVLRGKVWERGKPEPKEWMITAEDLAPNTTGSPGLFGNATNAEIFLDNISVTPNND